MCNITVSYFAKEGSNCAFTPTYPEIYKPRKITFKKGLAQKFSQPSGTGIDLGFFELDELSKASPQGDTIPLVIYAEASLPSLSSSKVQEQQLQGNVPPNAQITLAALKKDKEGLFQVKLIKQILWVDRVRYELHEIYGIDSSGETAFNDSDAGEECVICITEPKDTAVLPCRHMCLCSECAKEIRLQLSQCPICRQQIHELIETKINKGYSPIL
ncbi:hypothetical protein Tsubulata_039756 [Turnera subulata]|uniref:RING-type E3 ubiquitin transferase n=1 Tax=Turnera subulata TaxID=218843 RepID=A0A9Q0JQ41_9ROSI|nr:hypothetical protein Tsubulata_039756 [Turnera subulata]